ncbi:MAG: DUF86 domain-containing protein [Bdellovibrionota bacterium]
MVNDVIFSKCESIERCIASVAKYYQNNSHALDDIMVQDAIILNIERACQLSIDMGMFLVRELKLGVPKDSRDVFDKLWEKKIIHTDLAKNLKNMVSFRNIAVHEYKNIDLKIVESIIETQLEETFRGFIQAVLQYTPT